MSSEEQRLESKILYFEDMMFRYKGYEYQKVETIFFFLHISTEVVFTINNF